MTKGAALGAAGLFALVLAAYGQTLSFGFVSDDPLCIVQNRFIRNAANLPKIFTEDYLITPHHVQAVVADDIADHGTSGESSWRPGVTLSYFLFYRIFGTSSVAWHAMNLLYHWLAVLGLWLLARKLPGFERAAWFAAAIFAVHPLAAEPVSVVSYSEEMIYAAGTLFALHSYLRFRESYSRGAFAAAVACFSAALAAKESALVFFPLLFLCEWRWSGRGGWRQKEFAGMLAAAGAAAAVFMGFSVWLSMRKTGLPGNSAFFEGGHGPAGAALAAGRYLVWLFVPNAEYPVLPFAAAHWPASWADAPVLVSAALLIAAGAFLFHSKERGRFAAAWILAVLFPALIIADRYFAARYAYLAIAGAALGAAVLLERIGGWRYLLLPVLGGFALFAAAPFHEDVSFHRSFLRWDPENRGARYNLAVELGKMGDDLGSLREFRACGSLQGFFWSPQRLGIADALRGLGNKEDSARFYRAVAKKDAGSARAWLMLGVTAGEEGRYEEAERYLRRAAGIWPDWAEPKFALGVTLANSGRPGEARRLWESVLRAGDSEDAFRATEYLAKLDAWEVR